MITKEDLREIDDAAWDLRIYLDIMLGYLQNYEGDDHITELIVLTELMYPLAKSITDKF